MDQQTNRWTDGQTLLWRCEDQGRIWRAFRAFPGRPWRRTQDSVGHKTDDKREKKKEKKMSGKREKYIKKKNRRKRERKMDRNKREEIKKCS